MVVETKERRGKKYGRKGEDRRTRLERRGKINESEEREEEKRGGGGDEENWQNRRGEGLEEDDA